jgi:predicted membrane protein
MGVGGILLVGTLRLLPLGWGELWPLFLIGAGLLMLWNRGEGKLVIGVKVPRSSGVNTGFAIFGGLQRQITTEDFQGGNFFAIFGGGEIDLRRANIRGDSAVIEINAIFGGFEVKVPQNWMVVNEVVGVFGGTGDESTQPPRDLPGVKQLILRGTAIFGGVGIKN